MRRLVITAAALAASGAATAAETFQCKADAGSGIRNVLVDGRKMTVVNPKTPRIVFTKNSNVESRGDITKVSNEAWVLYVKGKSYGQLKNVVFELHVHHDRLAVKRFSQFSSTRSALSGATAAIRRNG